MCFFLYWAKELGGKHGLKRTRDSETDTTPCTFCLPGSVFCLRTRPPPTRHFNRNTSEIMQILFRLTFLSTFRADRNSDHDHLVGGLVAELVGVFSETPGVFTHRSASPQNEPRKKLNKNSSRPDPVILSCREVYSNPDKQSLHLWWGEKHVRTCNTSNTEVDKHGLPLLSAENGNQTLQRKRAGEHYLTLFQSLTRFGDPAPSVASTSSSFLPNLTSCTQMSELKLSNSCKLIT